MIGPEGDVTERGHEGHAKRLELIQPFLKPEELQAFKHMDYRGWRAQVRLTVLLSTVVTQLKRLISEDESLQPDVPASILQSYHCAQISRHAAFYIYHPA